MRGNDRKGDELFSYVGLEDRIAPDHPLRSIRKTVDHALGNMEGHIHEYVFPNRSAVHCAREIIARANPPDFVHHSFREAADGAVGLQHALPLVCWVAEG